mmetsp:Transcript_70710/g.168790  ORF Transcript_70710/g.168790 Transcript_70710/m.168790 type:complete len:283 (-) Transcript_70710:862-1710(-)
MCDRPRTEGESYQQISLTTLQAGLHTSSGHDVRTEEVASNNLWRLLIATDPEHQQTDVTWLVAFFAIFSAPGASLRRLQCHGIESCGCITVQLVEVLAYPTSRRLCAESVGEARSMPAAMSQANIDHLKSHQEVGVVHPERAVVNASASQLARESLSPFCGFVTPFAVPLTNTMWISDAQQAHHPILLRAAVAQFPAHEACVEDFPHIQHAVGMVTAKAHLSQLRIARSGAAHGEALRLEVHKPLPELLRIEARLVKVDAFSGTPREVQQRLGNLASTNGSV